MHDDDRSVAATVSEWVSWFGLGRLVISALSVVGVGAGAFFLLRSPPPSVDENLPRASVVATTTIAGVEPTPVPTVADTPLVVHVAGEVHEPGVYELPPGSRIREALAAAGGLTAEGDDSALNLAAPLVDGSRITVGQPGDPVADPVQEPATGHGDGPTAGPVDVNRATTSELEVLPGIGPALASALVVERERNGPFVTVDDLERVPGIGPAKLAALRDLVVT